MAYSEKLADRIRERLAGLPKVEEKKMMGGYHQGRTDVPDRSGIA